jgi:hypothetical protein
VRRVGTDHHRNARELVAADERRNEELATAERERERESEREECVREVYVTA